MLSNGRILGFYMGVFAASDQDIETLEAQHPDYVRYALDAPRPGGKLTVYSAQGCANDLAFANTALLRNTAPTCDRERLNAEFVPFEVRLTDKNGKPARETVIAVVALNNAIDKELRPPFSSTGTTAGFDGGTWTTNLFGIGNHYSRQLPENRAPFDDVELVKVASSGTRYVPTCLQHLPLNIQAKSLQSSARHEIRMLPCGLPKNQRGHQGHPCRDEMDGSA